MLGQRDCQCLLQRVTRQHDARAGLGQAAGDHGAAFPGGGVAAAPVEGAEFFQFAWPGLRVIAEQRAAKTGQSR